ncbi:MAG TPA: hypothetical protein VHM24_09855, partial [Gemmatimonadaceae bacterium]|nr:hypothetical protein [Gemmatimonadaceae bacterium]
MTEPSSLNLVGVGIPTLQLLRGSVLSGHASGTAVVNLREAGFAGGEAVYSAFERWLSETRSDGGESAGVVDPGTLPLEEFGLRAAEFFRNAGWGNVTFA